MGSPEQRPRWASKVAPHKVRRLYALDARGIVDEELIDDVGYAMYARVESILEVTEASRGRVKCPSCRTVLARKRGDRDEVLSCACGWRTTWGEYHKSYKGKQLHGGAAFPAFVEFSERWPKALVPRDKLLLIDRVVHALHQSAEVPFVRPAAVQLIAGNMREVTALLEELAYGDLSAPGTLHVQREWKRTVEGSKEAMAEFWARRERRTDGD